jgi:integrase
MIQILRRAISGGRFLSALSRGLVVSFLAYTGLRYGEMAALAVADFDMLRRRVQVHRSVTEVKGKLVWSTPKGHERRSVPFPRFLTEDLARRMAGKGRDDLVFAAPGGGVLSIATFPTRVFNPSVAKLRGIDDDGKPTTDWPRPTPSKPCWDTSLPR